MSDINHIEVLDAGMWTSIQDEGRPGYMYYGVSKGGCMDTDAASTANLLVGNQESDPVLEFNFKGGSIEFSRTTKIALTGADMQWELNDVPLNRYRTTLVNPGDRLAGTYSRNGARAYLAIHGKVHSPIQLNSQSMHSYVDICGVKLNTGEKVFFENKSGKTPMIEMPIPNYLEINTIDAEKGPEYDYLSTNSKEALKKNALKLSSDSNRMAAKLICNNHFDGYPREIPTSAILPGFIQLLPDGSLVVILQDGQTTGGYPRVLYLAPRALSRFNQLMFNQKFNLDIKQYNEDGKKPQ